MASAKDDSTLKIGCPGLILDGLVSIDGKANLVALLQCVDLVPFFDPWTMIRFDSSSYRKLIGMAYG
jgi:hypothetical protein